MKDKQQKFKQITHPDEFIEGKRYSVLLQRSGSHYSRITGVFVSMESEWCTVCQKHHLEISLRRNNGKIGVVCWGDFAVKDWREAN